MMSNVVTIRNTVGLFHYLLELRQSFNRILSNLLVKESNNPNYKVDPGFDFSSMNEDE